VDNSSWQQINISYPGETPQDREQPATDHLHQLLPAAEATGLISMWWFIRKSAWRIRYLPSAQPHSRNQAHQMITDGVSFGSPATRRGQSAVRPRPSPPRRPTTPGSG
jgi:thiopeptide-type bacteriocin biosynthesis protein